MYTPVERPKRPGTTTFITYECGHTFVQTTNSTIYDPAGLLCENQSDVQQKGTCGHCETIKENESCIREGLSERQL